MRSIPILAPHFSIYAFASFQDFLLNGFKRHIFFEDILSCIQQHSHSCLKTIVKNFTSISRSTVDK